MVQMKYNGAIIPTPMNPEILAWAEKTRLILQIAELPASVKFYNIGGTSTDTPFHTWYANRVLPFIQWVYIDQHLIELYYGDCSVDVSSQRANARLVWTALYVCALQLWQRGLSD